MQSLEPYLARGLRPPAAVRGARLGVIASLLGCGGGAVPADMPGADSAGPAPDPDAAAGAPDAPEEPLIYPQPCPDLYAPELLPTFEIAIDPAEWAALYEEFVNWQARSDQGLDLKVYHPLQSFRYGAEVRNDVEIRLKGNPWFSWPPYQYKMQFVIRFADRFHGVKKLNLDAPWYDPSHLRERSAFALAQDLGLAASCTNHARLVVNGAYYGVYTNIEQMDRQFVRRNYPSSEGNLWKNGYDLESGTDDGDIYTLTAASDLATLDALGDLDQWVRAWAIEAVLPHADGYYCCYHNWFNYHDPVNGWQYLLYDTDGAFDWGSSTSDPTSCDPAAQAAPHVAVVLADPGWCTRYLEEVAAATLAYDPERLNQRIATWSAQIASAEAEDPNSPYGYDAHVAAVQALQGFILERRGFLGERLGL